MYDWSGALLASVAAVAWVVERVSGKANGVTELAGQLATRAPWLLAVLAAIALTSWLLNLKHQPFELLKRLNALSDSKNPVPNPA